MPRSPRPRSPHARSRSPRDRTRRSHRSPSPVDRRSHRGGAAYDERLRVHEDHRSREFRTDDRRYERDPRDDDRRYDRYPNRTDDRPDDRYHRYEDRPVVSRYIPKEPSPEPVKEPLVIPENLNPDEVEIFKTMGFAGFDTTHGKKVEDNTEGCSRVIKKRKYRQYMNRKGGFNRPLDHIA